jgi:hypothetical protein
MSTEYKIINEENLNIDYTGFGFPVMQKACSFTRF